MNHRTECYHYFSWMQANSNDFDEAVRDWCTTAGMLNGILLNLISFWVRNSIIAVISCFNFKKRKSSGLFLKISVMSEQFIKLHEIFSWACFSLWSQTSIFWTSGRSRPEILHRPIVKSLASHLTWQSPPPSPKILLIYTFSLQSYFLSVLLPLTYNILGCHCLGQKLWFLFWQETN